MKKIVFFLLIGVATYSYSQQIQWASTLIKYSSDLGGKQNGIKRILGKPDAFPQGGSSPNAWCPKDALKGRDYVEVGFEKPQDVKQVAIFENLNAGCVYRIMVDNGSGNYETVWSRKTDYRTPTFKATLPSDHNYYFGRKRRKVQEVPDVLNPGIEHAILDHTISNVVAVRVEFNFSLLPGQKQIDAIGISDSDSPIEATIHSNAFFESLPESEVVSLGEFLITGPTLSQNGNELYFTDDSSDREQIYSCTKLASGTWSQPNLRPELSDNPAYNYVEFIGDDFILHGGSTYNKGTSQTGFTILNAVNGKYENPEIVKIAAYNNYDDTADATITSDRKKLIISIETDFTQGGKDLYYATLKEDGSYGLLQNMGKVVNSAADELTPQLLSDGKTLLFSSNGFSIYGDYDIFISYRLDDTWKKWSEPFNLGSKVNSTFFEASPYYDEKNEVLYFIRISDGKSSLYSVKIAKKELMQE